MIPQNRVQERGTGTLLSRRSGRASPLAGPGRVGPGRAGRGHPRPPCTEPRERAPTAAAGAPVSGKRRREEEGRADRKRACTRAGESGGRAERREAGK